MNVSKNNKSKSNLLIISSTVFVVVLTFVLGVIFLNNNKYSIREDGYYKYLVITSYNQLFEDKDDPVAIVGLTNLGYKQDYLHIPKEINGHPVTHLGYYRYNHINEYQYPVRVPGNIKKVFVYDNIVNSEFFYGENCEYYDCSYKKDNTKLLNNNTVKMTRGPGYIDYSSFYGFKHYYVYSEKYHASNNWDENVSAGNVEFMNNYPNDLSDNYYSLDNVNPNEILHMPPDPVFNGYNFLGWYTEPECINKFDFSISPLIKENEILRLYAGWNNI